MGKSDHVAVDKTVFEYKQNAPFESPHRGLFESAGLVSSRDKMWARQPKKLAKLHEDYSRPCCNRQKCFPEKQITPFESQHRALLESACLSSSWAKMLAWQQKNRSNYIKIILRIGKIRPCCSRQNCFPVKTNHTIPKPTSSSVRICGFGVVTC